MRPDLITHTTTSGAAGIGTYSTMERVGLATSLEEPKMGEVRPMKRVVPRSKEVQL
jgi:hypothetical protein